MLTDLEDVHQVERDTGRPLDTRCRWTPGTPLEDREEDRKRWLWEGILYGQGLCLLTAPGNTGKTRLLFELMAALSTGRDQLHGRHLDPGLLGVPPMYVMTVELDEPTARDLAALTGLATREAEVFTPHCWWLDKVDSFWVDLATYRQMYPTGLIVIDSATSVFHRDSKDDKEVGKLLARIKELGGPIVLIHHETKDRDQRGAEKVRGTTAWVDQSDRLLRVWRVDGGGLGFHASRRGPDETGVLPVPWATATQDDRPARGVNSGKFDDAKAWILAHADFCTRQPTVKACWEAAKEDGIDVGIRTFEKAYIASDLTGA